MNVSNQSFLSIEQLQDTYLTQSEKTKSTLTQSGLSFQDILQQINLDATQGSELKFSKHAVGRLETRNITLSQTQVERLQDGVKKADEKGIKDSLLLMDKLAFIVNVPSKTVITAMDQTKSNEQIYTNIDGAVIV